MSGSARAQSQVIQSIGSYDLFGKSLPGAIFALGLVSLLPRDRVPFVGGSDITLINIAALFLLLLIAGLTIGQGIHTLADNIEKSFLWVAKRIRRTFNLIRLYSDRPELLNISTLRSDYDPEGPDGRGSLWRRLCSNWRNGLVEWVRCRYWGMYDSLIGHRYLFFKYLEWNFSPENEDRWETESKGVGFESFAKAFESVYKTDLRKKPEEIMSAYPLVTSRLENSGIAQFRHFQALYSFCRSMWVVSFIFAVFYTVFLVDVAQIPDLFQHHPVVFSLMPPRFYNFVPLGAAFSALVFFDASGTYKRHYVEYLISAYSTAVDRKDEIKPYENQEESSEAHES